MAPDAPLPVIRASYRARARQHHPDRSASGGEAVDVSMAEINEAYRVLSDPGRRAVYDRSLGRAATPAGPPAEHQADLYEADPYEAVRRRRLPDVLSPDGPARFPWKAMLVVAVVGSALVLVSAALADPPSEEPPDGIIRTESCIAIEPNGDAREVACTGEDDLVVELFVPLDARCPAGMVPHRDRLGMGIACVAP